MACRFEGSRGKETVEIVVYPDGEPTMEEWHRSDHAHYTPGAHSASIRSWPISYYRERYGGDAFALTSPTTGRTHHVSLRKWAHTDPNRTHIEIKYRFFPAPFQSKEAQLIRERTLSEIRRTYESAIECHTGELARREAQHVPPEHRMSPEDYKGLTEHLRVKAMHLTQFAIDVGILVHGEVMAINNEYAAKQPDLFSKW